MDTEVSEFCSHCLPQKVRWHFRSRLSYYPEKIKGLLKKTIRTSYFTKFNILAWSVLMDSFKILGLIVYESDIDEDKTQNRHLIFYREAKKRGLEIYAIKFFGKYTADFVFYFNGKKFFYEGNPIYSLTSNSSINIDDKFVVKKLLRSHNLPTAEGSIFINKTKAKEYGKKIGFPLVVKPRSGSLGNHVSVNINSLAALEEAVTIAKQYRKDFIVEKYIEGRLYRATVIGKKYVFISERDAPNVIGDGYSTIEELVRSKDLLESRHDAKNFTLHKIHVNNSLLKSKNYSVKSVPKKDQKIYVNEKAVLSFGCDVINCSDEMHPHNKKMFIEIAQITNNNLVGIDFICKDISVPYKEQESAVLELNSLPYIDMHENPSIGLKIPVSKIVWDFVLEEINKKD